MKNKKRKSFIQWFLALFAVVFLGAVASICSIPFVNAAVSGSLTDASIGLSDSGSGTYSWSASGTTINGSATGVSGTCNDSASDTTLTITNNKTVAAELSFAYTVTVNSGTIKVNNTTVSANGNFGPTSLASGGSITVYLKSQAKASQKTSISITSILLFTNVSAKTYFEPNSNGSYTVTNEDGYSVTVTNQTVEHTTTADKKYTIRATPASGYRLDCWYKNDTYYVETNPYTFSQETNNARIKPSFAPSTSATYEVGTTRYFFLNDAVSAASSTKKITVVTNGTVPAGTYSIPSGYTLLVPCNSSKGIITTAQSTSSSGTPSAYKTLSIADGVTMNISGTLDLAGYLYQGNGRTAGACGMIKFLNDATSSTINIKSGGKLYSWGYIWGNAGKIVAESNSQVYESFNLAGWRGGNATSDMLNNSYKVFPVNQFFVQNIEVELDVYAGAQHSVTTFITAAGSTVTSTVPFMGSSGMFRVVSGYVSKRYDPSIDTNCVETHGQINIEAMNISVSGYAMNSANYVLPLSSAYQITICAGSTVTTGQDIAFLPGSKMFIEETGKFIVDGSNKVYVYDRSEWGTYAYNGGNKVFSTVWYTPNSSARHAKVDADIVDAEIDVNGSIEVSSNAKLYTTTSGANIHSSGKTGSVQFKGGPAANATTYQAIQGGEKGNEVNNGIYNSSSSYPSGYVAISVTNAQLRNGQAHIGTSNEYYVTPSGKTDVGYNAVDDEWGEYVAPINNYTITFHDPITNNSFTKQYTEGTPFTMPTFAEAQSNGFAFNDYSIKRWEFGKIRVYDVGQSNITDMINDNITFEAFWGGWEETDGEYSYVLYDSNSAITRATGMYRISSWDEIQLALEGGYTIQGNSMCLFDNNGLLRHNAEGIIEINSKSYFFIHGVLQEGYGLIAHTASTISHLYFILEDGTIVKGATFYIPEGKTNNYYVNGIKVEEGLYYFDNDGYMYYGNSLITDDIEFGVISSTNGAVITNGGGN